jgi:hypothetical protein
MPTNTTFDPSNIIDFEKSKLNKSAIGIQQNVTAGQTVNIDYVLTDDLLILRGVLLVKNSSQGDYVDFQVLHPVYGLVAQFVTSWFIDPDSTTQETPTSNYPAKLAAGLTLRLVYHSVGQSNVWVAINYDAEKVLV